MGLLLGLTKIGQIIIGRSNLPFYKESGIATILPLDKPLEERMNLQHHSNNNKRRKYVNVSNRSIFEKYIGQENNRILLHEVNSSSTSPSAEKSRDDDRNDAELATAARIDLLQDLINLSSELNNPGTTTSGGRRIRIPPK